MDITYPKTQSLSLINGKRRMIITIGVRVDDAGVRAMLNDPETYPNPSEFRPERFLKNGQIDESVLSPGNMAFGFGRRWSLAFYSSRQFTKARYHLRMCPGRHIALSTVKLTMASVLLTFNISKKVDENGKLVEPRQEYTVEMVSYVLLRIHIYAPLNPL